MEKAITNRARKHLRTVLKESIEPNEEFCLKEVYDLALIGHEDIYKEYEDAEAAVRTHIQDLEQEGFLNMRYRENTSHGGIYYLSGSTKVDSSEKIFDIGLLKRHGRIVAAPNIKLVEWAILPKDQVMSHSVARLLDIPCQTRQGQALFQSTIDEITQDVIDNGYDYHCHQPAVSKLKEPVHHNGKTYLYLDRDGNNRYALPWDDFPCAIIESTCNDPQAAEYSLIQYGAIANNPNKEKKNDITADDVKHIIHIGFDMNQIEKTEDAVYNTLATLYKETRKKDRRIFVCEILAEEGVRVSIEPYDLTKAIKHLKDNYQIDGKIWGDKLNLMNGNCTQFTMGFGRFADHQRKFFMIFEKQLEFPENQYTCFSWLEQGNGVSTKPTKENIKQLRIDLEAERKKYITHCCDVADSHRKGVIKPLDYKWMAQSNYSDEKCDEFQ